MRIQDAYQLGLRLHQILLRKGIHSTVIDKEKFDQVWEEAVTDLKHELEDGALDELLLDKKNVIETINWDLDLR